jgi:hypothetical protein
MLYLDGLVGLVVLGLWIFCLIDVISTDESMCRNLSKTMWLVLVVILPAVGSLAWLVAGRPQAPPDMPYKGNRGTSTPVVHDRERPVHLADPDPDREAAYQQALRARAEEQRQAYRARQQRELGEGPDKT